MKTMTCRQLGGTCDVAHHGDDANDIIKAQDQHLKDAVAAGQADHEPALKDMKGRWKRPLSGMKWYRQVQRDFAELPLDAAAG
ncbi:MAG: hypothetical protein R2761_19190 [Acidimicrobiales bacterium]